MTEPVKTKSRMRKAGFMHQKSRCPSVVNPLSAFENVKDKKSVEMTNDFE